MQVLAATLGVLILVFAVCLLSTVVGAASGWIVGLFFTDTIRATLALFGVSPAFEVWELGATLGFVGAFFKTVVHRA